MKQYLYTLAAFLLITISAKAQKLTVVDSDGNGIHLDYYYSNTYRVNLRAMWSSIDKDGDGLSDKEYTITVPVKNGYKYWCRMGVKFNDTYESWNLSETQVIEIPQK